MTIKPTQHYVLVEVKQLGDSSIVLPENTKPNNYQPYGLVLDVGPDCRSTKPSDKIMFRPEEAIWLASSDKTKLTGLVAESSILAHVEDEDEGRIAFAE